MRRLKEASRFMLTAGEIRRGGGKRMTIGLGSKVTVKESAFSGELTEWNGAAAKVLSQYGKVNGEDAYVIQIGKVSRALVLSSSITEANP